MSLIQSQINSIAAIALDASLNAVSQEYLTSNYYSKSEFIQAMGEKQNAITQAVATIPLGTSPDFTYFVDVTGTSYPLFSSDDIIWKKKDNNISLRADSYTHLNLPTNREVYTRVARGTRKKKRLP